VTVVLAAVFLVAVFSGATAAVAGFGIGSLLTPVVAYRVGTLTAVTVVAIPHLCATAVRCWRLRRSIDRAVLLRFGLFSAAGSLAGALLAAPLGSEILTLILGVLLCLTGASALGGAGTRWRTPPAAAWALGVVSGLFGGLAGNQGGVRAVALLPFHLSPAAFVATSTAAGLMVDAARVPVYLWRGAPLVASFWPMVAVATAGVLLGTLIGERVLLGLTPVLFRRVVGSVVLAIGVIVLARGLVR
jgi:uncharacterized membrane protein YfcA